MIFFVENSISYEQKYNLRKQYWHFWVFSWENFKQLLKDPALRSGWRKKRDAIFFLSCYTNEITTKTVIQKEVRLPKLYAST